MYVELAILAVFVFLYSAVAGGIERTVISGAMVFTVAGLVIGPLGLGWLHPDLDNNGLRVLADITLALVLFIDAANADLSVVKTSVRIPQRMLVLGLPLTILLGFGLGLLIFDQLSIFELAILATMLAATDAALGKAVVTNKAVPARIREGLNIESGLNDGICVPVLFLFIVLNNGVEGGGLLAMTVACTVTVSIVAHGITANPLARRLGPRMESGAG
jgi:NhaP-type Na+/H+ or K+/H+ antiporter